VSSQSGLSEGTDEARGEDGLAVHRLPASTKIPLQDTHGYPGGMFKELVLCTVGPFGQQRSKGGPLKDISGPRM
jgi:hypothetical protein